MGLYSRFRRNTTGHGFNGNVVGAHGHSVARPLTGITKQHTGLPPKGSLSAHVPDPRKPGTLTVRMAQTHIDQIERPLIKPQERVNARTQGRATQFLKSATNLAGKVVGMGRGPAPTAPIPQFVRPDTPRVEVKSNKPLFETKKSAAERGKRAQDIEVTANRYLSSYNVPLHEANDRHSAL